MGKEIGKIYKHSQSQLSNLSIKAHVSSSSESQTSSTIKLTTTSVPSITYKHQNNHVFCSQNTIQNDATITKKDDINSCKTQPKKLTYQPFQYLIIIHNVFLPHTQVHWLLTHLRYYLWLVNNICVLWRKVNLTRPPGVLNQG